jgi:uncharacterized membrane protein (TIGR02234 family)
VIRRARLLAVLLTLVGGAVGVISGTQTWISVVLADGAGEPLLVNGASALPVLTPLSLAALALGAALAIVGTVLRYVFAVIAIGIGGIVAVLSAIIAAVVPTTAVAAAVTAATGISGVEGVAALVESTAVTPWPVISVVAAVAVSAAGVLTLLTGRRWSGAGDRKYRAAARTDGSRPHDAIDSWDDLSRGDDPTR